MGSSATQSPGCAYLDALNTHVHGCLDGTFHRTTKGHAPRHLNGNVLGNKLRIDVRIADFMDLTPVKKLSEANQELCQQCGNCTRCPYLAISLNDDNYPVTDPERCIGCSICSKKCFSGAIIMRERTPEEAAALKEE